MKKVILTVLTLSFYTGLSYAQKPSPTPVDKVIKAEESFNKLVARKGIKDGFLEVADPEGIVFKPQPVSMVDFYTNIEKQPGSLTWVPKFARISANGDLAFTAGPYVYQNGKEDSDKVYGDYVSIWRTDEGDYWFKLLINLGMQHPEAEQEAITDFKRKRDPAMALPSLLDPSIGKSIIRLQINCSTIP